MCKNWEPIEENTFPKEVTKRGFKKWFSCSVRKTPFSLSHISSSAIAIAINPRYSSPFATTISFSSSLTTITMDPHAAQWTDAPHSMGVTQLITPLPIPLPIASFRVSLNSAAPGIIRCPCTSCLLRFNLPILANCYREPKIDFATACTEH